MRLTVRDITRVGSQSQALGLLLSAKASCQCGCLTFGEHALHVASSAYGPLQTGGSGSRNGGHADPVAAMFKDGDPYQGYRDDSMVWLERLERACRQHAALTSELAALVYDLGTITGADPKDLVKNGQGTCPACDQFCSGAHNDRLRAGWCPACYRAWIRAGRPDRNDFTHARRLVR